MNADTVVRLRYTVVIASSLSLAYVSGGEMTSCKFEFYEPGFATRVPKVVRSAMYPYLVCPEKD